MAKPVRPEPKFFLDRNKFSKGRLWYEKKFFSGFSSQHKYIGEKSTSYIEHPSVAGRIFSFYPNARILIILRNPVDRAYSNYRFSVENGLENLSFNESLKAENDRIKGADFRTSVNPYAYRTRGYYIQYIKYFFDVFTDEQIKILIFEEFISSLISVKNLYTWLDVDHTFAPRTLMKKVNASQESPLYRGEDFFVCRNRLYDSYASSIFELERLLNREIPTWKPT